MTQDLQPGQLVIINGETCEICTVIHKFGTSFYNVKRPDGDCIDVTADQIETVLTQAAAEAKLAQDGEKAAQDEANAAATEALTVVHEEGGHTDGNVEGCPLCNADAAAELENAEREAAAFLEDIQEVHNAGGHADGAVEGCPLCQDS